MCVCVLLYVCPGACACVCMGVTECVPVCDRAVAGLPGGTRGSTSQFCGSLEVPSSQAAWEAAIAPVFSTSSGLYSFRKKKKKKQTPRVHHGLRGGQGSSVGH